MQGSVLCVVCGDNVFVYVLVRGLLFVCECVFAFGFSNRLQPVGIALLERRLCRPSQFCWLAVIETKQTHDEKHKEEKDVVEMGWMQCLRRGTQS